MDTPTSPGFSSCQNSPGTTGHTGHTYQTGSVASPEATYPIVAEIWSIFEATLMVQAKRLVEDIAQHQGRDSKALWSLIKPKIKVPLFDTDFPEPTLCSHIIGSQGTAIIQRCRSPCLLGFGTCSEHSHSAKGISNLESVDSIKDMDGQIYYVDSKGLARDKQGKPKGIVKEEVLYLFHKA